MKPAPSAQKTTAALKEFAALLGRLEVCADRLHGLLPDAQRLILDDRSVRRGIAQKISGGDFDRHRWGCTVATSLAPKFDSREFARAFRAALPPDVLRVYDPVRLKKILQRLCREQAIEMTQAGRGRTPAQYRVVPRTGA